MTSIERYWSFLYPIDCPICLLDYHRPKTRLIIDSFCGIPIRPKVTGLTFKVFYPLDERINQCSACSLASEFLRNKQIIHTAYSVGNCVFPFFNAFFSGLTPQGSPDFSKISIALTTCSGSLTQSGKMMAWLKL